MTDPNAPTTPPAGWYPNSEGRQQYWNGSAWQDHYVNAAGSVVTRSQLEVPPAPVQVTLVRPTPPHTTSGASWVGLALAILAMIFAVIPAVSFFSWIVGVPALVLLIIGLAQRGRKKLVPAIGLGLDLLAWVISIIVSIVFVGAVANSGSTPDSGYGASSRPTSTATPVDTRVPVTFAGDGEQDSASQSLSGSYSVAWQTFGDCYYGADLKGGDDFLAPSIFTADTATSGTNQIHDLDAGSYYARVITGPAPTCKWTVTLTPVQ